MEEGPFCCIEALTTTQPQQCWELNTSLGQFEHRETPLSKLLPKWAMSCSSSSLHLPGILRWQWLQAGQCLTSAAACRFVTWSAEGNLLSIHQCWWLYAPGQWLASPSDNAEWHLGKENQRYNAKSYLSSNQIWNNAHRSYTHPHNHSPKSICFIYSNFSFSLRGLGLSESIIQYYNNNLNIRFLEKHSLLFQEYSELFKPTTNLKFTPNNNRLFSLRLPGYLTCCRHNMQQHLNLAGKQSPAAVGIIPSYQVSPIIQHHLAHCSLRYPQICLTYS